MSRVALLDVSVLVALFDPDHVHHDLAHDWFSDQRSDGWATCPVTESGFVRVLSNPRYGAAPLRAADLLDALQRFCASGEHRFWQASVSLCDEQVFDRTRLLGHAQVTDVFLLGLAVAMSGCLATFDRTIPLAAVRGATPEALQVIAMAE